MPTREDILFGAAALRRHWLDQRDLHKAVRVVETEEKAGKRRTLGDVLIERGFLIPSLERELLHQLELRSFHCPACGSEHYGPADAETTACALCGGGMTRRRKARAERSSDVPATDSDLEAVETSAEPEAAGFPSTEIDAEGIRIRKGRPPGPGSRGFVYPLDEPKPRSLGLIWWILGALIVALGLGVGLGYWFGVMGR